MLVFVLTKSNISLSTSTCTSSFDGETLINLFPSSLKNELNIIHIEFNPVASTFLTRALYRLANLASKQHSLALPSKPYLQQLSSMSSGDLRLAVNNFQFIMTHALTNQKEGRKNKSNNNLSIKFSERDSSLPLFHALGKILYAKRLKLEDTKQIESHLVNSYLPNHLSYWKRLPLTFVPENILDKCGISGEDVVSWLHENVPIFNTSISSADWSGSYISWADAHLTGGTNWRLGLTPAADRNTGLFVGSRLFCTGAGNNYMSMVVARALILGCSSNKTSTSSGVKGFRALRAPESKKIIWRIKDAEDVIKHCKLSAFSTSSNYIKMSTTFFSHKLQAVVVGGWRENVLDRFPSQIKLNISIQIIDELEKVCQFGSNLIQPINQKKVYKNTVPLFNKEIPFQQYCSASDALEGDAMHIDDKFSDEDDTPI